MPSGICRHHAQRAELHGTRLAGDDSAHAIKPPKHKRFGSGRLTFDHQHRHARDKGVPYTFTSADQLLKDFFDEGDRVLKEVRK